MSLNKDRILNDLGNVMSQLQSADCGCMGKLFSNQSQPSQGMGYPLPTCGGCRRGCCRGHGHPMAPRAYSPCAGEPCSMNNPGIYQSGMSQPTMPFLDHTGTYQTGMDQTGMEQPGMGDAEMGQPGMGYHGMGQPGMGYHGMGQPGMGQPGMGQPGMGQAGMGQAGMGQRGMPMNQPMHPAIGGMGAHAPKLYADTYNYLSKNLMNPIVQEVYQDLKSITPENTMTNSPIGAQMGLKPGKTDMTQPAQYGGNAGMPQMGHGGGMNMANMGNPGSMNQMSGNPQQMGMDSMGMGPQIAKMMMGDGKSNKLSNPIPVDSSYGQQQESTPSVDMANPGSMGMGQGNPGSMSMGQGNPASMGMGQGNRESMGMGQGNPGSMGMGQGNPGSMGMGQGNPASMGMGQGNQGSPMVNNMGQGNPGSQMQDSNTMQANYMTHQSMNQPQHQSMAGGKQQNGMETNPMQQMAMGNKDYGEHTEGMKKFNEMFPGVTGVGGDLGFDPMAIAFQMNPANHKQSAMNSMNKMLMGDRNKWMNAANNHLQASFSQLEQQKQPTPQQQQQLPGQAQTIAQGQQQMQQQQDQQGQLLSAPPIQQLGTPVPQQQQQVYSATGEPVVDQLFNNQGYGTTANRLPTQPGQPGQAMYKEHLLPADSSRNMAPSHHQHKQYHYNPLGQPVEMLPAQMFRTAQETGPQTLSPQPIPLKRTVPANVKNTESKTSIMTINDGRGTGFNPSKTQLQHIYNQYKGSQSYSPSNIPPTRQDTNISEGHLTQMQNQRSAQPGNVSGGHLRQMQNQRNASPERHSGGHLYQIQNQRNEQPGSHSAGHITQNQWNAQPASLSQGHLSPMQNQWNAQPASLSQGHLSPMQNQRNAQSPIRQANVEQVGGDASANNKMAPTKMERNMGQIGDVPAGEPMNTAPLDDEMMDLWENKNGLQNQMAVRKNRNGLQDQVYTAGPITNAWSFTGRHRAHRPAIPQYRSVRAVNW